MGTVYLQREDFSNVSVELELADKDLCIDFLSQLAWNSKHLAPFSAQHRNQASSSVEKDFTFKIKYNPCSLKEQHSP